MLLDQITSRLRKREDNGELRVIEDYQAKEVNRRIVVDFSSNDYLSFSTNSEVGEDYLRKLAKLGRPALGASGSRTASGNSPRHVELENRLASLHGTEAALLFNSGYDANVAVWAYVPQPGDIVLFDELIHASIHEGLRLSRAGTKIQFAHNSVQELCTQLRKVCELSAVSKGATNVFLALETLYSMDGDLAPLESISSVVKELFPKGNCYVIVDEAHSTGIYGNNGLGYVNELALQSEMFLRVHTFGKAIGCNGAIILCPRIIRTYLINYASPFRFSTAMPFSTVAAINLAYDYLEHPEYPEKVSHLFALSEYLQNELIANDFQLMTSKITKSPIIPVAMANPRQVAAWLTSIGFAVVPLTFPNVPRGTERLRICVHAANTYEEVEALLSSLIAWRVQNPPATANTKRPAKL